MRLKSLESFVTWNAMKNLSFFLLIEVSTQKRTERFCKHALRSSINWLIPRSTEKMLDSLLQLTENDIEKRPKTGAVQRDRQKIYRNNSWVGTSLISNPWQSQNQGTMSTSTAGGKPVNWTLGLSRTLPNLKVNTKAWRILKKDRHTIVCGRRPLLPVPQTTHTAMPLIRIWPPVKIHTTMVL